LATLDDEPEPATHPEPKAVGGLVLNQTMIDYGFDRLLEDLEEDTSNELDGA